MIRFYVVLAAILFVSSPLTAAEIDAKVSMNEIYQKLLTKPDDVNLNLKYADYAIGAKDYEAAIPPLERILFFNPSLDEVKLKLGVLYYLLGSHQVAKSYLEPIASGSSKVLAAKASEYLSKMGG